MTTINLKTLIVLGAVALPSSAFAQAQVTTNGGQEDGLAYNDADGNPVLSIDDATASDASGIENVVTASGTFGGSTYTNDAFENVDVVTADPKLTVEKVADITTGAEVGDVITYTYTIVNTGNVTLAGVGLSDNHLGNGTDFAFANDCAATGASTVSAGASSGTPSATLGGTVTSFVPGDTVTCTATYTVTQDDVDLLQ